MTTGQDSDCRAVYLHGFPLSPAFPFLRMCFLYCSTLLSVMSVKDLSPCTFSPFSGVLPCSEANIDFFPPIIAGSCRSRQWVQVLAAVSPVGGQHSQRASAAPCHRTCCSVFHLVGGILHKRICRTLIFWIFFLGVTKNSYNFMWNLLSTKVGKVQTVMTCLVFHPESKQSLIARGNAWRKEWDYRGRKCTLLQGGNENEVKLGKENEENEVELLGAVSPEVTRGRGLKEEF